MWLVVVFGVCLVAALVATMAWLNAEMRSRHRSRLRRMTTIVLLFVAFPVGWVVWFLDRDNNPGPPLPPRATVEANGAAAPRFRDTLAWGNQVRQRLADRTAAAREGKAITAPCSVRGDVPGLSTRWRTGHLRIGPGPLVWWRHFSRRRHSAVLDSDRLTVKRCRPVRSVESILVNAHCTVVECELDGTPLEIAFRYPADLQAFLDRFDASAVPGNRALTNPWSIATAHAALTGVTFAAVGLALHDSEAIVFGIAAAPVVLVIQGRALARPTA